MRDFVVTMAPSMDPYTRTWWIHGTRAITPSHPRRIVNVNLNVNSTSNFDKASLFLFTSVYSRLFDSQLGQQNQFQPGSLPIPPCSGARCRNALHVPRRRAQNPLTASATGPARQASQVSSGTAINSNSNANRNRDILYQSIFSNVYDKLSGTRIWYSISSANQ